MTTQTIQNTIVKSYINYDKNIDVLSLIHQVSQRKEFIALLKKEEKQEAKETIDNVQRLRAMVGQYNGTHFWGILPTVCEDRIIYFVHQGLRSKIVKVLNGLFWGHYDYCKSNHSMEEKQTGTSVFEERRAIEDRLDKVKIRSYGDGHLHKIKYTPVWGKWSQDHYNMKFSRFLEIKWDNATPEEVNQYYDKEKRFYEAYKKHNTFAGQAVFNFNNYGPNWSWSDCKDYWDGGMADSNNLCYTGRNDIEEAMVCNEFSIQNRAMEPGISPKDYCSWRHDCIHPKLWMKNCDYKQYFPKNYFKHYPYLPDHPVPNKAWLVPQLKAYLKENGLTVGGNKTALFKRAYSHWKSQ